MFAGELIEHLENQGMFLDCAKNHLKEKGLLILTTPNQFSILRAIANLFGILNENHEHVLVHNKETIKHLLERKGFKLQKIGHFTNPSFYNVGRLKILRKITKPLLETMFRIRPQLSHQILIIATVNFNSSL